MFYSTTTASKEASIREDMNPNLISTADILTNFLPLPNVAAETEEASSCLNPGV